MGEKNLNMAILDSGISDFLLQKPDKEIVFPQYGKSENTTHGTTCYLIIKRYSSCKNLKINNICILNSGHTGMVSSLDTALRWCLENRVMVVNMSCGTTNFKDYRKIREIMNYYYHKGILFIAASSNKGLITFPASLATVIGVETTHSEKKGSYFCGNIHNGVNAISVSEHEIVILGEEIKTPISNSYAAPYITSQILNMLQKYEVTTVNQVVQVLFGESRISLNEPNWISCGMIVGEARKTRAVKYFRVCNNLEECDTIIFLDVEESIFFDLDIDCTNKNCINISSKLDLVWNHKYFYWTPEQKKECITAVQLTNQSLQFPIIQIRYDLDIDIFYLLCELKNMFAADDYDAYVISSENDCCLYDLNYIPEEFLSQQSKFEYINSFIYWENYYHQFDIAICSVGEKDENINISCDLDIQICSGQRIEVFYQGDKEYHESFETLDLTTIYSVYNKILEIMEG